MAHLQTDFGIARVVLMGDRGLITQAQLRHFGGASGDGVDVEWHLRRVWAPLLFEDETLPRDRQTRNPVAPAKPSPAARQKKLQRQTSDGLPVER